MGKKRAYVVTKGRQTGIFETWDEVEPLVKKYKGAKYQGYSSRDDAEQAWRANQAAAPSFATAAGVPAAPAFVPASSCVFFAQGRCRNGAACPFSHDGERPICVFYNTTGCNNGAACPFRHEGRPASAPFVPAPPPPPPTPSIRDMKAAILHAGLGVADLVEKSDVVERYRQALAAARPAVPVPEPPTRSAPASPADPRKGP